METNMKEISRRINFMEKESIRQKVAIFFKDNFNMDYHLGLENILHMMDYNILDHANIILLMGQGS
jgi:hypothetical protein